MTAYLKSMNSRSPILLLFHPSFYEYINLIPSTTIVYYAHDAFSMLPRWTLSMSRKEERLVEEANIVIGTSEGIIRSLPGSGPQKAIEINNGVEYGLFCSGETMKPPEDVLAIPGPRIGYVGRISPKVDLNLVAELAAKKIDWHWVFVGPVILSQSGNEEMEQIFRAGLEKCQQCPNVHFLGHREKAVLPAYMANMDVNVICMRTQGGWWEVGYPLKLHEYLAVGRPVIGSMHEIHLKFRHVMDIATSPTEWLEAIARAIQQGGVGTVQERRRVARANDWEMRIDQLEALLGS